MQEQQMEGMGIGISALVAAAEHALPGLGALVKKAIAAGVGAGNPILDVLKQILAIIVQNSGPQIIALLQQLINNWLNPPKPAA